MMRSSDAADDDEAEFPDVRLLAAGELNQLDRDLSGYGEGQSLRWVQRLQAPLAILEIRDGDWSFAGVSAGFLHALELSLSEIEDRRLDEVLSREAVLPLIQAADRVRAGATGVAVAVPVRMTDRRSRRVSFSLHAMPKGAVLIEAVADIPTTGATALRRVLLDHLNLIGAGAIYVYDRSPSVALNLSVLLGFAGETSPARSARGMVHPEDLTRFMAHRRSLGASPEGEVARVTARMRHTDGDWRWIEVREQVLSRGPGGAVRQILGFASDVTEHYRLAEASSRLSAAVLQAELDERRRIARELHDSMAQHLVVIDLALSRMQREAGDALPIDAVEEIKDALQAAHGEVRTFSYLLHPPDLKRLGLAGAIRKFATGFGARTGLILNLAIDELPTLDAVSGLTLFRIAQEALMNVHRHARASHVEVRLHVLAGEVELDVLDDGVGTSAEHLEHVLVHGAAGVGISGMKARLEQLDGRLRLEVLRRGFRLRATLPVRPG
jgi:PAS domain S-box-containing protein